MPSEMRSDDVRVQYDDIIDGFSCDANDIIHSKLPAKVMQLQRLLKEAPEFNLATTDVMEAIEVEPYNSGGISKKRKLASCDDGNDVQLDGDAIAADESFDGATRTLSVLKCNKTVVAPLFLLKGQMLDMIELIGTVKISIQLAIPRIEDGNNFGVSIQEETVSELSRAEDSVFSIFESMSGYFVSRAKVGSKMLKYPEVQDYLMAVRELDSKMYTNLRLFCSDLRNNAALLHDLIIKNLEKIRSPRSSNHQSSMY